MITLTNADKILKSVYLDAVTEEIKENTSPFISRIEETSDYISGKEIIAPCRIGINGGVGCAAETASLPTAGVPNFLNLKASLCNIYGNVEFTDKILRVGQGDSASAVNILNHEMENLLKSAKFNMRRMLFQSGDGVLCTTVTSASATASVLAVDSTKNLVEGMIIDINNASRAVSTGHTITNVDRVNNLVSITPTTTAYTNGYTLTVQGSLNNEIFGLPYIFSDSITMLYGNVRSTVAYAKGGKMTTSSVDNDTIQSVIDHIEEVYGSYPNLIIASYDMRRKYLEYLRTNSLNVDHMEIEAGFNSITYNGIPLYVEKFAPENKMYFINTDDYKLAQLGDWSWIEGNNGGVLNQVAGKPAYYASLVKYCNLLCLRPMAQVQLTYTEPVVEDDDDAGSGEGSGSGSGSSGAGSN